MGWIGFVASIVIALIVGSIFKVFREARGGNLFAALIGAQLGIFLFKSTGGTGRLWTGVISILCAIVVSWLLSLGGGKVEEETKVESGETPTAPPSQNP